MNIYEAIYMPENNIDWAQVTKEEIACTPGSLFPISALGSRYAGTKPACTCVCKRRKKTLYAI